MSPLLWLFATGCGLTSFLVPIELDEVDLRVVPDLDLVDSCVSLGPDERVAAVSPEGHAWLLTNLPAGPRFRIVDPYSAEPPLDRTLDMPPVDQMRAWSSDDATFSAGGTVWRLANGESRLRLSEPPVSLANRVPWCGELETNGIIVTEGQWVEQQADAWYSWDPGEPLPPKALLDRDGQCEAADGVVWGLSDDGRLWRVGGSQVEFFDGFLGWRDATGNTVDLGILLQDNVLWVGSPERWEGYELLSDRTYRSIAGGGDALWVVAGDDVLRLRQGVFERLAIPEGTGVANVQAHAGGAWVEFQGRACHYAEGPAIRVTGVRPHQTTRDEGYGFTVEVVEPGLGRSLDWSLAITANGQPLDPVPDPSGSWFVQGLYPDAPSTTFAIEASRNQQALVRELPVHEFRLPGERSWAVDIEPLFGRHCAECHDVGGISSDLTTWESWVDSAANIDVRVLRNQDMPPADATFGEAERAVVAEWIGSGLRP